ncbi:hypothetical protein [Pseudobacteriovorax antillogorgiicola]|uniref:Uncharacterized protein n=1 Tax=Pseudobacteriovorax antillogorgiicola TaxID=1513793 RepID=A0A1Y6CGR7_9BACT|nr:hypothetical protein [Pseudobacteriovorax antillogorgiicola]TCS48708.1 hypothetical protein EDD56_117130 [Pseudobacteriovorax antillogorgiicola]SMF54664.1 hypothetical protein SAMN06296036_11729 [Pseudobacteriovorax antillogorgiicola]
MTKPKSQSFSVLLELGQESGFQELRDFVLSSIDQADRQSYEERLRSALLYLNYLSQMSQLSAEGEFKSCLDMAAALINLLGIHQKHHRLAPLQQEYYRLRSLLARHDSNIWASRWNLGMACHTNQEIAHPEIILDMAESSWRVQDVTGFYDWLAKGQASNDPVLLKRLQHLKWQAQRILGDSTWAESAQDDPFWVWQHGLLAAQVHEDFGELHRLVKKGGDFYNSEKIIEFNLWVLSGRSRAWLKRQLNVKNLKRRKGLSDQSHTRIYELVACLQDCYDYERPLLKRIEALGDLLPSLPSLGSLEWEMLAWCAAGRWLVRSKAQQLADLCFHEYKKLSLALSLNKDPDLLNRLGV